MTVIKCQFKYYEIKYHLNQHSEIIINKIYIDKSLSVIIRLDTKFNLPAQRRNILQWHIHIDVLIPPPPGNLTSNQSLNNLV